MNAWLRGLAGLASAGVPPHEASLRRVGLRLAAQTVVLLLALLIVIEGAVYFITQHSLRQSLETTLRAQAHQPSVAMTQAYDESHSTVRQKGDGDADADDLSALGAGRHGAHRSGDVSVSYLGPSLKVVGDGGGPLGGTLLDRGAARTAWQTHRDVCCSVATYDDDRYLVYADVVRMNGRVKGVVEAAVNAQQYFSTLEELRLTLILVALLGLVASGIISAVLAQRSLVPIRQAMQRQRQFVADAAHELRTPLAIMRTAGEIGLNEESPAERQASIEQMLAENAHLTRLVDDLSLLARADNAAISIEHTPVDLAALVSDTAAEIGMLAEEQDVRLTAETAQDVWVQGDIMRLRQLLLILLDNALKYTPPGGAIELRAERRQGRAVIQVHDTGPGIEPSDLPRIFDRFYRSDRARSGEGSGLGLAIGRWIVEAHGGTITAGNVPDGGAIFTITLPPARSSPIPQQVPNPHPS